MTESNAAAGSLTRPCVKCRAQEATLDSRSQPVCRDCFTKFIATKCIKQVGILGKETRPPPPATKTGGPPTDTRRYLLGLSLGVSSTALLHLLNGNVEFQLSRGRSAPFDLIVIHIDASGDDSSPDTEAILARYRARYPRFTFHCVPLSSAVANLDLSSLPILSKEDEEPKDPHWWKTLPTAASRTDVARLLTRQALLAQAVTHNCQALLLGHSTTALAELTLAEAAKGRGFALPWVVQDGFAPSLPSSLLLPVPHGGGDGEEGVTGDGEEGGGDDGEVIKEVLVYHPLRDALRKELVIYAGLVDPPLTELISNTRENKDDRAVVSHKDLSIEEVMLRYFAEVEESYPSVVANVARTTGKLVRAGEGPGGERCGLCGMPLDEDGDQRWRGELGIQERSAAGTGGRLCYGCERSTGG
ncbi:hypothetical protein C8A01DRAFT_13149 [Parachaetomium inaequale]|uniref:Cytoplasmic tRNA 2-thiolation protein 2 n=1 Tax=Parachaetomium inaequale TaxID=2588326 RepID=A0AAN6SV73_9PEZI|nr:hypothetical protein C8A01DRAFT_13149 [Parachaetomium inaequale]